MKNLKIYDSPQHPHERYTVFIPGTGKRNRTHGRFVHDFIGISEGGMMIHHGEASLGSGNGRKISFSQLPPNIQFNLKKYFEGTHQKNPYRVGGRKTTMSYEKALAKAAKLHARKGIFASIEKVEPRRKNPSAFFYNEAHVEGYSRAQARTRELESLVARGRGYMGGGVYMTNMMKALQMHPWLNTVDDWQRFEEAKIVKYLQRRRKK